MISDPAKNGRRQRPEGVGYEAYRNRFKVYSKLTETNWLTFRAWCVANKHNYNSGLNYLIATHPEIQKNA